MAAVTTNQVLCHFDRLQEEDVQKAKLIVAASSSDQPAKKPAVPERYRRPMLMPAGRGKLLKPSTAGRPKLGPEDCVHPPDQVVPRGSLNATWPTCLCCKSHWERVAGEFIQGRASTVLSVGHRSQHAVD